MRPSRSTFLHAADASGQTAGSPAAARADPHELLDQEQQEDRAGVGYQRQKPMAGYGPGNTTDARAARAAGVVVSLGCHGSFLEGGFDAAPRARREPRRSVPSPRVLFRTEAARDSWHGARSKPMKRTARPQATTTTRSAPSASCGDWGQTRIGATS